ncbi:cell division protein FtsI (penicillin-binding protein 3) [Faunimonas pinastri]|uniref:Cell division protein FtsI (Penicillin-binding protein 3) n=1 Tax=Faunimonas pinastri TaxID=1855383 RepID=A0A1H9FT51_9HYPH|nr:penicillin-binding protein 2 [Faunimonas pinastri]SEQ40678.1 cell division protein FtsI (penicillin-binding protein 3) [Faunimonas pinastri]
MIQQTSQSAWRHVRNAAFGGNRGGSRGGKVRVALAMGGFGLLYSVLAMRLVMIGVGGETDDKSSPVAVSSSQARPDITDRRGEILATDIKTASLFAEPRKIVDPDEATELLTTVFPDMNRARLRRQLSTNSGFVYLRRELTPRQQQTVHDLGIPGIGFRVENKRFYPGGATASHVLGEVNIDNQGIAGIEKYIDRSGLTDLNAAGFDIGHNSEPVKLSIDLRVQNVVRDEIAQGLAHYEATGAVGIVMDVRTGEVIAMSSGPDYDPNDRAQALDKNNMNRATVGVYEMGSTFKTFTTAMALDAGAATLNSSFDASHSLQIGRNTIHDFHSKGRWLTVPEIFKYSSNVGTGRMVLKLGVDKQKEYLKRFGFLDTLRTELPEAGAPIVPKAWPEITSVTVAFGHGISVSALQTAAAGVAVVNGGVYFPPTFLTRSQDEAAQVGRQVIKPETSADMRKLLRLNVIDGSGRSANIPGYLVGGKTGTAEKVENGRYSKTRVMNAFLSAFPMDKPRYLVFTLIDDPKNVDGRDNQSAHNAAPMCGNIIRRIAPMLDVAPRPADQEDAAVMAIASAQ